MFNDYKQEILQIVNTEAGKFLLSKLGQKPEFPIVDIGKDYFIEDTGERKKDRKVYRATFYSKVPIKQLFVPILDKIHIANDYKRVDKYKAFLHYSELERGNYPQIYLSTDTFYPDADPESTSVDGNVGRSGVDETFSTIRNGAGNLTNAATTDRDCPMYLATPTTNQYQYLERFVCLFDTHTLGGGNVISATLSIYSTTKTNDLGADNVDIVSSSPASNTALTATDYNIANWGTTLFATGIALSSIATNAYNNYTLNASGIAHINTTGVSKFGSRLGKDISGSSPTWASGKRNAPHFVHSDNGSNKPKLVVTYTPSSGAIFFGTNI